MSVATAIRAKLTAAFQPTALKIIDESHRHAGHAGARPEGQTHFRVEIVSAAFEGKSRLERHRMIYVVLSEEISKKIHALTLIARSRQDGPSPG